LLLRLFELKYREAYSNCAFKTYIHYNYEWLKKLILNATVEFCVNFKQWDYQNSFQNEWNFLFEEVDGPLILKLNKSITQIQCLTFLPNSKLGTFLGHESMGAGLE
jgi:hypothetical protein